MSASALLALTLLACGGIGPEAALRQATEKLGAGDFGGAEEVATEGLETNSGAPEVRWRLELARLEALARGRQTDIARMSLERLSIEYAGQVEPALYVTTADQLRGAGDPAGALALLEAGAKRFRSSVELVDAIAQAKSAGLTDVELLEELGYVN